jgi:hypothetical protein
LAARKSYENEETRSRPRGPHVERVFDVTFAVEPWRRYVAHRIAEPERFLPPPGWTSAFPTYDTDGTWFGGARTWIAMSFR